jgi:hypothetical protein
MVLATDHAWYEEIQYQVAMNLCVPIAEVFVVVDKIGVSHNKK